MTKVYNLVSFDVCVCIYTHMFLRMIKASIALQIIMYFFVISSFHLSLVSPIFIDLFSIDLLSYYLVITDFCFLLSEISSHFLEFPISSIIYYILFSNLFSLRKLFWNLCLTYLIICYYLLLNRTPLYADSEVWSSIHLLVAIWFSPAF